MTQSLNTFWLSCLDHFRRELNAQQFNTWIKPLQIDSALDNENEVVLIAPNRFVSQWVKDNFIAHIEKMAQSYFDKKIQFLLKLSEPAETKISQAEAQPGELQQESKPTPRAIHQPPRKDPNGLNPQFTFDNFVTGKANQLARAGAIQVAESPGIAYNPLFIYGGVGLGKTHLIQAIGNYVYENDKSAKIRYVHAEKYVSDVVSAYQHKAFDKFKLYYHSLDLLLVDDVQFFGGKNRTQEEFFYAFNTLIETHKQVIITCDTYPKEITGLEERLVSRFGWGLTVAVEPPELEMRVAILLKKAELEKIHLEENVAFFIAKHIRSELIEAGFPVLKSELINRVIYAEAALWGATPSLMDRAGPAAQDIAAIADEVDSVLAVKHAAVA